MLREARTMAYTMISLLMLSVSAPHLRAAELATPADLPATPIARQAIDGDTQVQRARAALEAARIEARLVAQDPYEFNTRITGQRRSVRSSADFNEWSASLERPVRLPGKAALDAQLGELALREAQARYGDALHSASRDLLGLWIDWLAASHAQSIVATQLGLAQDSVIATEKRVRVGDAARLDAMLANGEMTELARAKNEYATQASAAAARLRSRFPALKLDVVPPAQPSPLSEDAAVWLQRVLAHSHELRIPEAQLARARLAVDRARAERTPDPVLGAHFGSEAGGDEKIVGASIAFALPGERRSTQLSHAVANAEVARSELDMRRREIEAEVNAQVSLAQGNYQTWRAAEQAAQAASESARLMQRAQALGEADLQTVLQARRLALAAAVTASQARFAALRAQYALLVDAHSIWDMEASDHD